MMFVLLIVRERLGLSLGCSVAEDHEELINSVKTSYND
jgi:hypothetical protein